MGRPASIQLCILIDRGHRELQFVQIMLEKYSNITQRRNKVKIKEHDGGAIYIIESEKK
jgi:pyrimidine operon attenuation protein/uracil phosphoribosyltransferase